MIHLDWTLAASALIFLITLLALNRLLFRPLLATLDERKARTTGVVLSVEEGEERYQAMLAEYEERIKTERQAGYRRAEEVRDEALKQRQERVAEARREAEELLRQARESIDTEAGEARARLRVEAQDLARAISTRILERA